MPYASERNTERAPRETASNGFFARRFAFTRKNFKLPAWYYCSRRSQRNIPLRNLKETSGSQSKRKSVPMLKLKVLLHENYLFFKKRLKNPLKAGCISMISFYQRHLSKHTCLYSPTCSEYTKRCINNWGVTIGTLLGLWRIIRCNPLSKGGSDPAPEVYWKIRWLV